MIRHLALTGATIIGLISGAPLAAARTAGHHAAAPTRGDGVRLTPAGGMMLGRADAHIKLVEYESFTCPHCGEFAMDGLPQLRRDYIDPGRLSLEIRPLVRDPIDLVAVLLSRTGGPSRFLTNSTILFAAQPTWLAHAYTIWKDRSAAWAKLPPAARLPAIAHDTGLFDLFRRHGYSAATLDAALASKPVRDIAIANTKTAADHYKVPGTPGFILNGTLVQGVYDWAELQPILAGVP